MSLMTDMAAHAKANPQVTNKVFLRPIDLSDADVVSKCLMDERVCRNTRWNTCKTEGEALSLFRNTIMGIPWCQAVCVEGVGPVGFAFLFTFSGVHSCRAEGGICIAYEYWSRGIATAAIKMAVEKAFEEMPQVLRLEATVHTENIASAAATKKAGIQRDGLLRSYAIKSGRVMDMHLYSCLRPSSKL